LEEQWKSGQAELLQEDAKYKRIYSQLKQQRDAGAKALSPADLKYYEDLRKRKAGVAVAPLQNGQCGVCHILVPTGVVSAVRSRKDEAVLCPSCGRMLFAG
jgi:predicted  nucleic acid-binding Zn-ribbon protein